MTKRNLLKSILVISAFAALPAFAFFGPPKEIRNVVEKCAKDMERYCASEPMGPKKLGCLVNQASENLDPGCKQAVDDARPFLVEKGLVKQ
jgi:hypothetical protein